MVSAWRANRNGRAGVIGNRPLFKSKQRKRLKQQPSISHPLLVKELKDGQNFIGFLQQLCQTLEWELPAYEFSGETPEFVCACTVWAEGRHFTEQGSLF